MVGIAALALAYVLSQFFRSFLAVLAPDLRVELGMSEAQLSTAASVWFLAFALMQFPVGAALDRLGPRLTASATLLVAVLGSLVMAGATGPSLLFLAMGLIGVGCSAILMASLVIFARSFPPRRFALLSSWFVAFGLMGGVAGSAPLAAAVTTFGWRWVMVGLAAITLLAALAIVLLARDPEAPAGSGAGRGSLKDILRLRMLWPLMAMAAVAYAPASNLRGLWAGPFLEDVHGFSTPEIGEVTFFMALGLIVGSIVHGPLDNVFDTRKWIVVVGSCLTASCLAALAAVGIGSSAAASVLLVLTAFAGTNYSLIMAHARGFMPPHLVGRGVTLMNFFSIGGSGVVQLASGGVFDLAARAGSQDAAYRVVFLFYVALLLAGLSAYLFSRDAKPSRLASLQS
ncbi:MFS transporter [Antarcticirhabdus aurantiaca]|uniref:MFS transporter n=1 Tax=Antarcticirhabdus aurantiaca TaxID=2606717 RepID=A0ACD4NWL5_9HYPH|nr:MFS transporter [Antarcticirhabdus aurantiaca]WAJ31206.1 MFS transporter [Jeongeuplla avenae]